MREAHSYIGEKEIIGPKDNNPTIVSFWKSVGSGGIKSDSVPWCAAFVGAVLERSGKEYVGGVGAGGARNYLDYGSAVDAGEVRLGDIVVFSRDRGWSGHVGFYAGETETEILLLGGNQGDRVSYGYFSKDKVLGYRRPVDAVVEEPSESVLENPLDIIEELESRFNNNHPLPMS